MENFKSDHYNLHWVQEISECNQSHFGLREALLYILINEVFENPSGRRRGGIKLGPICLVLFLLILMNLLG